MKPRHAFLIAIILSLGAVLLVQRLREPSDSISGDPVDVQSAAQTRDADKNTVASNPLSVQDETRQLSIRDNQTPDVAPTPLEVETIYLRGDLRFKTLTIDQSEAAKEFEIDIEYPQLVSDVGVDNERIRVFNREARRLVRENAAWALKDSREGEKIRRNNRDQGFLEGGFINASYEVTYASDHFISVKFSACGISGSAASAACETFVLNYDLQYGKVISPRELFLPRPGYVKFLMAFCEPKLRERYGEGHMSSSVTERAKEYRHFVVTGDGIEVAFSEYTFAPGGAGIHSVLVPYEIIKDKLDPRTPVAAIARGAASE